MQKFSNLPNICRFSDLDVKDLIDLETGRLLCQHCDTELVEDEVSSNTRKFFSIVTTRILFSFFSACIMHTLKILTVLPPQAQLKSLQDRSSVSLFNEQTKTFTEYLKITDNTKLSGWDFKLFDLIQFR